MNIRANATDIRAKDAYRWTSQDPERRAQSQVDDYRTHMAEIATEFSQWETPDNADALGEDLEAYRSTYAAKLNSYLSTHSRIASQFITGASGWTGAMVRTNNKRNDSADNKLRDLIEWSAKRLDKLRDRYDPRRIARQPIRSGDVDALERLTEKIERLERFQEGMKAANKIIRSKVSDDDKIDQLVEIPGISETTARKLLQPDCFGGLGFASYALTNNSANIRRLKDRFAGIEQRQKVDAVIREELQGADRRFDFEGGYVLDNPDADRYQVFHDSKPARDVIDKLKRYGLRWTPSVGCWQAYRTPNGKQAILSVTGISI